LTGISRFRAAHDFYAVFAIRVIRAIDCDERRIFVVDAARDG